MRECHHLRGLVHAALSIVTLFFIIHDSSLTGVCLPGVRVWLCWILLLHLFSIALLAYRLCCDDDNQGMAANSVRDALFHRCDKTLLLLGFFMYAIGWWMWSCSDDIEAATQGMLGLVLAYLSIATVGIVIYVLVMLCSCILKHLRELDANHNFDNVNNGNLSIVPQLSTSSEQLLPYIAGDPLVQRSFDASKDHSKTCTICLNSFEPTSTIIVLPCLHEYDLACIKQWLQVQSSCPMCRCNIISNQV